ncbi:ribosomal protein S2 [Echinococcus multilocularis]|uniref:Ribosomal protein S2 n=1 Tax=Echinococcus multilocularis TaxID=6211 RepID=A0A068XZZ4_ECHMU|nr:ribosomal protein S2 [Echinococcus multilocularis]
MARKASPPSERATEGIRDLNVADPSWRLGWIWSFVRFRELIQDGELRWLSCVSIDGSDYSKAGGLAQLICRCKMGRTNRNRPQRTSKKPIKKQMRKKQSAIVQRCIQALDSNAHLFRKKVSEPLKPSVTKPPGGFLKHFKPIQIETAESAGLVDVATLLGSKVHLGKSVSLGGNETLKSYL